ncbi:MAG: alpha-hydroxy-acid oxidizing protein, partial [Actinobacteria bacterium]|nr:alpha-hydroxy-acid oxidizing protein [Actinomycetota bacterium]
GDRVDVILDGGVRRGSDIVKALCLGARVCTVGRAWVFGLGADGVRGVDAVLTVLEEEIANTLALIGVRDVRDLTSANLA